MIDSNIDAVRRYCKELQEIRDKISDVKTYEGASLGKLSQLRMKLTFVTFVIAFLTAGLGLIAWQFYLFGGVLFLGTLTLFHHMSLERNKILKTCVPENFAKYMNEINAMRRNELVIEEAELIKNIQSIFSKIDSEHRGLFTRRLMLETDIETLMPEFFADYVKSNIEVVLDEQSFGTD